MKKLFITLILLVALILGGIYGISSLINQPTPSVVRPLNPNEELVSLTTSDNVMIKGSYMAGDSPDSPAILMLHGNGASRSQFGVQFNRFNEAGYAVLAIDFRGHGKSQDAPKSYGVFESLDAKAAFDWLKKRQNNAKVGVVGVSLGGAAALVGKDGPLLADAMILQAVFPDIRRAIGNRAKTIVGDNGAVILEPLLSYQSIIRYGVWPDDISPVLSAANYKGAALVLGGGNDIYTPPSETKELHKAINASTDIWIIPDMSHGLVSSINSDEYIMRTLQFFDTELG